MNNIYTGVIIEESLANKEILKKAKITHSKIEAATERHKTHWVKQWTLHTVEVPEDQAEIVALELSKDLDSEHDWYADYKNDSTH